jgi:hypothetical protein
VKTLPWLRVSIATRLAFVAGSVLFLRADAFASSSSSSPECGGTVSTTTLDPTSTSASFPAGSIIIPMDSCYNPDNAGNSGPKNVGGSCGVNPTTHTCYNQYGGGNDRLPFGAIYLLAENNIPVSIILNQSKTSLDDPDFSIKPPSGSSTQTVAHLTPTTSGYTVDNAGINCSTNEVYYGGMPLVIDASFAAQALQVLTAFDNANSNLFTSVTFHVSNYPFSAPVLAVMASRPKPVLIDASPLDTFFSESGITSVAASGTTFLWLSGSGSNYSYTWPASLAPSPTGCTGTSCSTLLDSSSNRIIDVIWSSNQLGNLNNWASMGGYFQKGGTVLGLDDAVSWESGAGGTLGGGLAKNSSGAQKGAFCPAVAVKSSLNELSSPGPTSQYPASNRFLQLDDISLSIQGNGGGVDGSSGWDFASAPASRTQALSNGNGYEAIAGHPMVSGTQTQGNLVFLASLNSWHGNSGNKDGGLHILFNTLIAGGGANTSCSAAELTRSSSVANLITKTDGTTGYAEYLGSFDWAVPASGAALGNVLYQADPTDYPYVTGHFREYKPVGTYTASTVSNTPTCSTSDNTSPCNWDAATKLKPFAQRNVYVGTGSSGSYTLKTAASMTATDSTISYISTHLDNKNSSGVATSGILGGIDWSTAAVIEARNVGGFTNRPTIAYVGARDGMLHAFCVAPATGTTSCYGAAAGEEIWAIIPPGMKKKMDSAYNGGSNMDWSQVNVGGAIRVADLSDKFASSTSAINRTILIVGMHDTGYVDALDITDPNPTKLNQDGFRFLWENDGTQVVSGVTSRPMGPTNGATLAQVSSQNTTGVAIVTSATCYGTGLSTTACPTSVTAGFNTYVIRLADGYIVSNEQQLYTRTSSLLSSPIPNDAPPLPTTLDIDGDATDETVYVSTLEGRIRKYTLTAQGVTAPTLAKLDSAAPTNAYDASTIGGCASGVACQPIGVSPTIVRNENGDFDVLVATGGADWARATTNKSDQTATTNPSYLTGFDANTGTQFPTTAFKLGGIQPPASAAGGSSPGTTTLVPLSLRAYAQLTVAGSDLYANVTSISIGSMQQLLLPLMTPGTYGNVLKWTNINSTTPAASGSILTTGTAYAGGAGSILETDSNGVNGEIFAPGVSSSIRQSLGAGSSSLKNTAYAINSSSASGNRPFSTLSWFDLSN